MVEISIRALGACWKLLAAAGLLTAATFALAPAAACGQESGEIWTYVPDPHTPIAIDANTLAVNSQNQTATFSGHVVVVVDGAFRMRCIRLVVHYRNGGRQPAIDRIDCEPDYVHLID